MNATDIRALLDHYFDLMGRDEDFAICYADDMRWRTFDGDRTIVGPAEVRDYLTELHESMPDMQTGPLLCTAETAYIEGDCADPRSPDADRIAFCLAYDVSDGLITEARFYGPLGFLVPMR
jgi:hypothetical protein